MEYLYGVNFATLRLESGDTGKAMIFPLRGRPAGEDAFQCFALYNSRSSRTNFIVPFVSAICPLPVVAQLSQNPGRMSLCVRDCSERIKKRARAAPLSL